MQKKEEERITNEEVRHHFENIPETDFFINRRTWKVHQENSESIRTINKKKTTRNVNPLLQKNRTSTKLIKKTFPDNAEDSTNRTQQRRQIPRMVWPRNR